MTSMYDSGEYLERNSKWHVEDSAWKAQHVIDVIERLQLPHQRVCDIGCGAGEVIRQLSMRYPEARFTGCERAPAALEMARSRATANCEYVAGDLPLGDHFDIAMALDVFEHVEDYFSFLRTVKVAATTKIFHIPLDMSALGVAVNNPMWARRNVGHLHYFSKETALAALVECGYEVIYWKFTKAYLLDLRNLFVGGRTVRKLAKLLLLGVPRLVAGAVVPNAASRILGGCSLLVVAR
jgi:SAM-dependent methyltransferase